MYDEGVGSNVRLKCAGNEAADTPAVLTSRPSANAVAFHSH